MARTIKEIADSIKEEFLRNDTLTNLYGLESGKTFDEQFSAVSIETIIINVVAFAMSVMENLWDIHKQDIDRMITEERYGYAGWYERVMKAFQMGDDINQLEEKTYYDTIDESKQIIKFAYCSDDAGNGILIKIAKANADGLPEPLSGNELTAATAYINRVKPAGIPVTVRSDPADKLSIALQIKYNPLIYTSSGDVNNAVEEGINDYLTGLSYNGAFVGMKLIDVLQVIEGIEIVQIASASVVHGAYNPEDITGKISYIPVSGYMELNKNELTTVLTTEQDA
ncbi:MAG: hypothetical protein LBQ64_01855 [Bacteroidales bacterium]|nr:hypothetical protein [Bacteroidales bacterium]